MFPGASGSIRNVLAYGLDGRFHSVVATGTDAGKEKDEKRCGFVEGVSKTVETATHWKLLGSSVRLLLFYCTPLSLVRLKPDFRLFCTRAGESTSLIDESRTRNGVKASTSNPPVKGAQW